MSNLDSCLSYGIFGGLTISPNSFIIPQNSNNSPNITITFVPSSRFFDSPQDTIVLVEFRDKDENVITGITPIISSDKRIRYQYTEVSPGRFQIIFLQSEMSINGFGNFEFSFSITEVRPEYQCATINVDALSSGFGFVYNYFKIEANSQTSITPPPPNTGDQPPGPPDGVPAGQPPPDPIFVEKILSANQYYLNYIEDYENFILSIDTETPTRNLNSEIVNENMLPNLNVLSLLHSNNKNISKRFLNEELNFDIDLDEGKFGDFSSKNNNPLLNLASLGGLIDGQNSINFPSNVKLSDSLSTKSYFEEVSEDVLNIYNNLDEGKEAIANSFYQLPKTFLFNSQYEKVIYPKINNIKNIFPMYSHVFVDNELIRNAESNALSSLNTRNITQYQKSIEKSRFFTDSTLKRKLNKYLENNDLIDYFYYCLTSLFSLSHNDILLTSFNNSLNTDPNIFLNLFFGEDTDSQNSRYRNIQNLFYIGDFDYIEQGAVSNNPKNSVFLSKLKDAQFIRDFLTDQILIYRIDKWRADDPRLATIKNIEENEGQFPSDPNLKPLQSYYIINNFDNTFLELLDSQVKFGKEYEYRLYKYSTDVDSFLNVRIKKQFMESIRTTIMDDPPVPPGVQIIPFKNIDTEFLFLFSTNSGRFFDDPIAITAKDSEEIRKMLPLSLKNKDGQIQYEGDDLIKNYELMRLEIEPKSYTDFANSRFTLLDCPENGILGFTETVEPNKKYYYTARSIDVHGKFSNPFGVVEIELINESGTIYLRKRYIDFEDVKFNVTKELDKYLQIRPSTKQIIENDSKENSAMNITSLQLGPEKSKVWNKNYVLRLTSKTTGKKIDIKFKFSYNLQK